MNLKVHCWLLLFCLAFTSPGVFSQSTRYTAAFRQIDSLLKVLKTEKDDTSKVKILNNLAYNFHSINPDSTILLAQQAYILAAKLSASPIEDIKNAGEKEEAIAYVMEGTGYQAKSDFSTALVYDLKALKINEQTGNEQAQAKNFINIGTIYMEQNIYPRAMEYFSKALKINNKLANKQEQAVAYANFGIIYSNEGDYAQALNYNLKALKIFKESGEKNEQAGVLNNLGALYTDQSDYSKALNYNLKALNIFEESGEKAGIVSDLCNIGGIYSYQGDYPKALDYYLKALKITKELGDRSKQVIILVGIGNVYEEQALTLHIFAGKDSLNKKALNNYLTALKIAEEIDNKEEQALNLANIGSLYCRTGRFKKSEEYLKNAIHIDSNIGKINDLRKYEEGLSQLYDTTGRYKLALQWFKKAMVLKDTLFNMDKSKALTRKELTFKFQQQQDSAKARQAEIDAIHNEEVKRQNIIIYAVSAGLLLVLLLAFSIFRSLQQNRKKTQIIAEQKAEVEHKNLVIEQKNKDIIDSITYAKRLQDAILPPLSLIEKYFPESFVLYKPKDIVAGDFYWMERVTSPPAPLQMEREERGEVGREGILIAACDCTGHGVPGALVSVVCSNALNRAVKEFHITQPGKILDKTRELVLETFEKSEGSIQDGMDISLLAIGPARTVLAGGRQPIADSLEIQWAGAYNSLWYIQNGLMQELVADKQPIGKVDNPTPFNTHSLALNKGDTLYLFTDGFADQFGGPKGKKFKYQKLKEELLTISRQPLARQKQILEKEFENWKGELEQTDDVCVIGIRI